MVELIIIATLSENRIIRNNGRLPWNIPEDLRRFDELVRRHPAIMGRHTFQLIWRRLNGRPLPNIPSIVLSRTREGFGPGVDLAQSFEEAVDIASFYNRNRVNNVANALGGEKVYQWALTYPSTIAMELTYVKGHYDGDAGFPLFDIDEWLETKREYRDGDPSYSFASYIRK